MDTSEILKQLQLERRVLENQLSQVDAAICAVQLLANGHAHVNGNGKKRKRGTGRRGSIDWNRARRMYEAEGKPVAQIATTLKCGQPTIYAMAKASGWKRKEAAE